MSEVLWDVPKSWEWTNLGNIADWASGGTPKSTEPSFYSGQIPWLIIGDLNDGVVSSSSKCISAQGLQNSSAKVVKKGSILIAMYGSIGKLGIAGIECTTNQAIAFTETVHKGIVNEYLFYYLLLVRRQLNESGKGGAQQNISQGVLKTFPVCIPPYPEQQRIVAKLEELTRRVNKARARLKAFPRLLERFRKSALAAACSGRLTIDWREQNPDIESASALLEEILKARRLKWEETQLETMLANGKAPKDDKWKGKYIAPVHAETSELDELPEAWVWGTWNEVSNWVTYGFTRPMPHSPEGIPIVTAKHVVKRKIVIDVADKTTEVAFADLSDKDRPEAGDILITKDGSIGRAALVETNRAFCINQSVAVVWLRSLTLNKKYLLASIEAPLTQDRILEKARGAAIQHLSITDFAKMPVPIPPKAEQQEIANRLETLFKTAEALEARYHKAKARVDKLTQSILAKAFRGELVPQDPNDEPASLLLERIVTKDPRKRTSVRRRAPNG
jgi:type I restriction enzyme S subunit